MPKRAPVIDLQKKKKNRLEIFFFRFYKMKLEHVFNKFCYWARCYVAADTAQFLLLIYAQGETCNCLSNGGVDIESQEK